MRCTQKKIGSFCLPHGVYVCVCDTVILERPIRIPRSLSVKAGSVLKGFLNKASHRFETLFAFFAVQSYASVVYAMALCLSVCLCLCPSQVGVLLKRLNIGSNKQHHSMAWDSSFLTPRSPRKLSGVTPYVSTFLNVFIIEKKH